MNTIIWIYFALWGALAAVPAHDFHVSVAQVDYQDENLQASFKIFSDDLVKALEQEYGEEVVLDPPSANLDSLAALYLQDRVSWESPGQPRPAYTFVGLESEVGITYLYASWNFPERPGQLTVTNRLLVELFSDQSNLINVEIDQELQSAYCNADQPSQTLKFQDDE